jgi:hypothetical protein
MYTPTECDLQENSMLVGSLSVRVAAVLVTLFLTSDTTAITPSQAAEAATKVSERELRQLFPGQFHAIAGGLLKVSITALADGTLFAQQVGKSDTGIWNIRSGQLCIKFSKWLKGRTRCSTVTEKAGWYRTADVTFKKIDDITLAVR